MINASTQERCCPSTRHDFDQLSRGESVQHFGACYQLIGKNSKGPLLRNAWSPCLSFGSGNGVREEPFEALFALAQGELGELEAPAS